VRLRPEEGDRAGEEKVLPVEGKRVVRVESESGEAVRGLGALGDVGADVRSLRLVGGSEAVSVSRRRRRGSRFTCEWMAMSNNHIEIKSSGHSIYDRGFGIDSGYLWSLRVADISALYRNNNLYDGRKMTQKYLRESGYRNFVKFMQEDPCQRFSRK
jgi:hypothetical protein